MKIRDMTSIEVTELLDRVHLGRLACSHNGQPHITPLSFVHEQGSLFAFSTLGRKIAWMRDNPLVCVEFEEVQGAQSWNVVLVEGRYEELVASHALYGRAFSLLERRPMWWEPGYVQAHVHGQMRRLEPVYFRIAVTRAEGRRGEMD
ncbi:MAG TPA: pyridoxamine 5'-phosphate oxidase family protein [Rhizomicrobium sp.]|nr:pyridoxamine 5'-phosphate oxidase family protein [Rhizomicrobium sp.]